MKTLQRAIGSGGSEDSRTDSKPQSLEVYFLEGVGKLRGVYRYDLISSGLSFSNLFLP